MLRLASATRPTWLGEVAARPDLLLVDHAHCERKAASSALALMFRYPEVPRLQAPLSALAREELVHFELVLGEMGTRGIAFRRLEPAPYAARLHAAVRREEPDRLVDSLLAAALIEARSCERMTILSEGLEDARLRELYGSLLASEARHHAGYLELASGVAPRDRVMERLDELAGIEAEALRLPGPEPRMHS